MNPEVEDLFDAARRLKSPAQRQAFLNAACHGVPQLRQELEELLALQPDAEALLDPGAAGFHPEVGGLRHLPLDLLSAVAIQEQIGDRVGRYKLREKLGEGGCGVVYVADQEEPMRRRVALKVIKAGMDTKSVIARFDAERQALALMDHPNIAKVLDAGATDTGRPYFVMELVRGVKITEFCDQNCLTTEQRLELFIQLCQAVQHAHQKGIIHRDLKPSNILVTLNDGVAVPKIIDFGIAKATEGRLTDLTVYTELNQFLGTPAYMSPEQALMTSVDIDTRSDIYSLGVLLYELLTGKPPFENKELLTLGLDEMRRTIREKEPLRPSTRLSTLSQGELDTRAKARGIVAPRLLSLVRGDLDSIVMKCLEKDRARRYQTANGLTADIQRHLHNEPVEARSPSALYRLQKMVRCHRLTFAAVAAVAAALVIGAIASAWEATQAREAQAKAEAHAYASDMNRVQQAWDDGDMKLAQTLLTNHIPALGQRDLRGFEWRYLWNLCRDESMILTTLAAEASCVAFSPEGRYLAAASGHKVELLDVTTRQGLGEIKDPTCAITCMAFSPADTNLLATAGDHDDSVKVWDLATKHLVARLPGKRGWVQAIAFSPDGRKLASGCETNLILWSLDTAVPLWIRSTPQWVSTVAFAPDGESI